MATITITGHYAQLSRGRISAKHIPTGTWAERGNDTVILDRPGKWMVSQTDGFNRKETVYVIVNDDGSITDVKGMLPSAVEANSGLSNAFLTHVPLLISGTVRSALR
jgi:hypothetical protein